MTTRNSKRSPSATSWFRNCEYRSLSRSNKIKFDQNKFKIHEPMMNSISIRINQTHLFPSSSKISDNRNKWNLEKQIMLKPPNSYRTLELSRNLLFNGSIDITITVMCHWQCIWHFGDPNRLTFEIINKHTKKCNEKLWIFYSVWRKMTNNIGSVICAICNNASADRNRKRHSGMKNSSLFHTQIQFYTSNRFG